jgi:hypothetical protein
VAAELFPFFIPLQARRSSNGRRATAPSSAGSNRIRFLSMPDGIADGDFLMELAHVFIVGAGAVGKATGEGFLAEGHEVTFIDGNSGRLAFLRRGPESSRNVRFQIGGDDSCRSSDLLPGGEVGVSSSDDSDSKAFI